MKKKMMLAMIFGLSLLALTACGKKVEKDGKSESEVKKTETETEKTIEDYNVDDYVTKLGNYKGVEYIEQPVEPSEDEVKAEENAFLKAHPKESADGVVKNGDTVNIDFMGKKDGVAFDGGTAKGYDLGIGSGNFIPGFEEGLVGMKKGETKDLDLKFPETYHAEDLKGAAVVFTVTINKIMSPVTELTDELVAENSEFKTVSEFRSNIKKGLYAKKKEEATRKKQTELLRKVIDSSEIKEIPVSLRDAYVKEYVGYYQNLAANNNMEFGEYLEKVWKMKEEDVKKAALNIAESLGKQKLVIEAIAKKEGFSVTTEEYKAELEEFYKASGVADKMDKATFEKNTGKKAIEDIVIAKKVIDLLEKEGKKAE